MFRLLFRNYGVVSAFRYFGSDSGNAASTIFALSSGQGKCGVAVIRVSGREAAIAVQKLARFPALPEPRHAYLKALHCPLTGEIIDKGLVLWFPRPHSFTGEDVCEFQVHGGPAVISGILEALGTLPDYRIARPGEFTRRAFYNKKIDLVEAEGLADLINAETEYQRKQAYMQSQGALSRVYNDWRTELFSIMTRFEALFNFELAQALCDDSLPFIAKQALLIYSDISNHLRDDRRGERLRDGVDVVIIGAPNVGKSSLYNLLCQKSAALVTPYPGTTRDVLDVNIDIAGYPITLHDTCGIRIGSDIHPVEAQGVEGARNAISQAQLLILVADITHFNKWREINRMQPIITYLVHYLYELQLQELINPNKYLIPDLFKKACIVVFNKCDQFYKPLSEMNFQGVVPVSAEKNIGIKELIHKLTIEVQSLCAVPSSEYPPITKIRHRLLLESCCDKLTSFVELATGGEDDSDYRPDYAIMGNYLRQAVRLMAEILDGKPSNEPVSDVLDEIFYNFCVGK